MPALLKDQMRKLVLVKFSLSRFSLSLSACACAAALLTACGGGGGDLAGADVSQAAGSPNIAAASEVNASSSGAIPQTAASGAAMTPFGQNASDYTLTFTEEFDSYNSSLWNDHIWYAGSNATKNFAVEDGKLKIWPQRDASGKFFDRTIDTDGKYYQQYGYFEMEAKLPKGKGTWPAFWLFNHIDERRPEMDVMEAYAGGDGWGYKDASGVAIPNTYSATVWVGDYEGHQAGFKMHKADVDLSADFHKYAVKWEPGKQTYYFDGKEVSTVNVSMTDPMYLMLDLWFGSASGTPDDSTPQGKGNSYEVNYVRAWQFK
ncbi:glycoside hydrolase family 16 protein [Noviherbaspirillum autotrophicum]|uniref:glycoside hydrolase family 16 protein n=1 Tax=Noviherbaspirillum autotrophicum TaxID=709839 RepID=UPI001E2B8864|nr:glycoside hydrolase family 16 protein [Noviherbaspirillum autotrophicum]